MLGPFLALGAVLYLTTVLLDAWQRRRLERRLSDLEDRVFLGEVESAASLPDIKPVELEEARRTALDALRKGRSR